MKRLNVGLIGLGRLGRVYARDLAGRIPETKLVAVADTLGNLAKDIADEFDVAKSYADPMALMYQAFGSPITPSRPAPRIERYGRLLFGSPEEQER